jgi:rubredoxin
MSGDMMGEWECAHCGYVANGDGAPDVCPECGAQRQSFVYFAYPDASAWEEEDRFIGLEIPEPAGPAMEEGSLDGSKM